MYLIIDCAIAGLYRHNGAMNKSVKLEPGTKAWNQTCYKDYMWSMLNCNGEFLGKDCSSAEIAMCLGVLSYCRLKRAPLSSSLYQEPMTRRSIQLCIVVVELCYQLSLAL